MMILVMIVLEFLEFVKLNQILVLNVKQVISKKMLVIRFQNVFKDVHKESIKIHLIILVKIVILIDVMKLKMKFVVNLLLNVNSAKVFIINKMIQIYFLNVKIRAQMINTRLHNQEIIFVNNVVLLFVMILCQEIFVKA